MKGRKSQVLKRRNDAGRRVKKRVKDKKSGRKSIQERKNRLRWSGMV